MTLNAIAGFVCVLVAGTNLAQGEFAFACLQMSAGAMNIGLWWVHRAK